MDLLKRTLAPITEDAWREIDALASRALRSRLTARALVDFSGPHGWTCAAVNLGRLHVPEEQTVEGLVWGTRTVLPLVEVRVPCVLNRWELDNVSRGAQDADLTPLVEAAQRIADFEETLIYRGFSPAGVTGLVGAATQTVPVPRPDAETLWSSAAQAKGALTAVGLSGPFALVLDRSLFDLVESGTLNGYPLRSALDKLLEGGKMACSPVLEGGVLLSLHGGAFELTVGQDLSIGYQAHDTKTVSLFFTESLTFRVLEPEAVVALESRA